MLLERRPQPITHLPTPCCFYFSDFLYACWNKSAKAEWKCHILNSPEGPKSIQLQNLKYFGCVCACDSFLCLQFLWHPLSQTSHNHVHSVISPTLVTIKQQPAMCCLSGNNTGIREAFTACRGSAWLPAGTRELHPCFPQLVCCVISVHHMPCRCTERKRRRKGHLPVLTKQSFAHKKVHLTLMYWQHAKLELTKCYPGTLKSSLNVFFF